MYTVTVTFFIHAQHQAEFKKLVLKQANDSLEKEADCHVFDVSIGVEENGVVPFFLYELYTDKASFDLHLETAHFANFNEVSGQMVADKQVQLWDKIS
ncbi:hypothetical protein CBF23_006275 [Marinomonas agarivorans]|nr:hypothetical protein CBF23_006275 [Marinomonas agarivorans]